MHASWKNVNKFITGLSLVFSLLWFISEPRFESAAALLISISTFGAAVLENQIRRIQSTITQWNNQKNREILITSIKYEVEEYFTQNLIKEIGPLVTEFEISYAQDVLSKKGAAQKHKIMRIDDFFYQSGESFVLTGESGSGKTYTLYTLLSRLIESCDPSQDGPIPILLDVSTWNTKDIFQDWVIKELYNKHHIPFSVGRFWIETNSIVYLLDGFDSVDKNFTNTAFDNMNAYFTEKGWAGLVVSIKGKPSLNINKKLRLNATINMLPIEKGNAIRAIKKAVTNLGIAQIKLFNENKAFEEMTSTPLKVRLITQLLQGKNGEKFNFDASTISEILDAIIDHAANVSESRFREDKDKKIASLSWIALQLNLQKVNHFSMQGLQPVWLSFPELPLFWFVSRFFSLLVFSMSFALIVGIYAGKIALLTSFVILIVDLLLFLYHAFSIKTLTKNNLVLSILYGFVAGIIFILVAYKANYFPIETPITSFFESIAIGPDGELRNILFLTFDQVISILAGGIFGLAFSLVYGQRIGISTPNKDIQYLENLEWNFWGALSGTSKGLIIGLPISMIVTLAIFPTQWQSFIEIFIVYATASVLLGFSSGGMQGKSTVKEKAPTPISTLATNSVTALTIYFIVFSSYFFILYNYSYNIPLAQWINVDTLNMRLDAIKTGIAIGIMAWLTYGGIDLINYLTLRVFLSNDFRLPFRSEKIINFWLKSGLLQIFERQIQFSHQTIKTHLAKKAQRNHKILNSLPAALKTSITIAIFLYWILVSAFIVINAISFVKNTHYYRLNAITEDQSLAQNGQSAFDNQNFEASVDYFTKAIAINPDPTYYNNRAVALRRLGRFEEALSDYNYIIAIYESSDPSNQQLASFYVNRARVYEDLHENDSALDDYKKALIVSPIDTDILHQRARLLIILGDYSSAIDDYLQMTYIKPDIPEHWDVLCWYGNLLEPERVGIEPCNKSIEMVPTFGPFYESRSIAFSQKGDYKSAISDLEFFLEWLQETDSQLYFQHKDSREQWLSILKTGNNPFTDTVLQELIKSPIVER